MLQAKPSAISSRIIPPSVITAVGIALTVLSWRRWPDILIDYGHELYVPWRIAEGERLYTDLYWVYGPISPYFNALLFRWFGIGFTTLFVSNLVLTAIGTALVYFIFRRWTSPLYATVITIIFLCLFAFNHLQPIGNYNFITPYTHNLTHSLLLSYLALSALWRFFRTSTVFWAGMCGACLGLVFLNKIEIFATLFLAVCLGWMLILISSALMSPKARAYAPMIMKATVAPNTGISSQNAARNEYNRIFPYPSR